MEEYPLVYVIVAYLLSAYISSYVAIKMYPQGAVGASGSIYCLEAMLISAIVRLYDVNLEDIVDIMLPLVISESIMYFKEENVAHWGHLSGFIVGLVLGNL